MKRLFKQLSIIVCVLACLTSCEDVLDQAPIHAPDESTFFNTEDDAQKALNGLYLAIPDSRKWWAECISDNAVMTNAWGEGGMGEISQGNLSPTTGYLLNGAHTEYRYATIRDILYFLDNVGRLEQTEGIQRMIGEARFLLALRYFRMARIWGDIVLWKEVPPSFEEALNNSTRAPKEEVFEYVMENVDQAISLLPDVHDKSGRIVQDAALMLKADVLIWMASLADFRSETVTSIPSSQLWADAATTLTTIIDKSRYSLHPDLITLFQSSTDNSDDETILARQYIEDESFGAGGNSFINILGLPGGTGLRGGGWASFSAPRNLIDDHYVEDGMAIQDSPEYDIVEPYTNRDKRLTSWYLLPGVDVIRQNGEFTPFDSHPDNGQAEALGGEGGGGRTGFWCTKYVEMEFTGIWGFQDWIVYRYGETLLMLAEALNESNPGDNRIAWAMNQIRDRAGLPGVDALLGDQAAMREEIRHERRIELAYEEKRLWDIMRWRIAHEVLNRTVYGINLNLDDYTNRQGDWTVEKFVGETNVFQDHFYYWPIPQAAIDRNPNLTQNPGY